MSKKKMPVLLSVRMSRGDYDTISKAADVDGRKLPDFVRHYLVACAGSVIANKAHKNIMKLLADEDIAVKIFSDMIKAINESDGKLCK